MANSPILNLLMMSASQAQKETVFNNFLIAMDALFRGSVLNTTLNTPPASPNLGDAYIVAAGGNGAWSAQDYNVTFYFNGWQFVTPPYKLRMYSVAQSAFFTFQGVPIYWTEDQVSTVSVLNDLTNVEGAPTGGQVLTYVAAADKWEPQTPAFTGTLEQLADVQVTTGAGVNGYALVWNQTAEKWETSAVLTTAPHFLSLPDVVTTGALTGWVLAYNAAGPGVDFVNPAAITSVRSLSQVGDVTYPSGGAPAITTGYVLTWNGASWVAAASSGGSGGGSSTLAGDSDVTITTPASGQVLSYNGAKWVNAAPAAPALPPVTAQTAAYTLALADANSWVRYDSASAGAFTIPPSASVAFAVGTSIVMDQQGAGQLTVIAGAGVTLDNAGATAGTRAQYSVLALTKLGTDEWMLTGDTHS